MSINLSKDSVRIVLEALSLLQYKKSKDFSHTLSQFKNPNNIAVVAVKDDLLDIANLVGIFSEGVDDA